jgi:S-adenosylmethionine:tRNA ribosyltransferase-isomerase
MWEPEDRSFAEILGLSGIVPLPPYLKREPVPADKLRYQTIYSKNDGAVAAPTAGLHFTKKIIQEIASKNHTTDYITLHVSAGTFRPIQENDILKHDMHTESIIVSKNNVMNVLASLGNIIAVGTTSVRTLETIYWYGVKLLQRKGEGFFIEKLFPYTYNNNNLPEVHEALEAVIHFMDEKGLEELHGNTQIFIFPGYEFKLCNGLITNYHMPRSTLMLLVAAFVGDDWKRIYDVALATDYRFLSYGDTSLLIP